MRHGNIQDKILKLTKIKPMKITELALGIYKEITHSKLVSLRGSIKILEKRGNVKVKGRKVHFIKDFEVVGTIVRTGINQKGVNIPKIEKTKDWEFGEKVKLEKI